MHACPYCSCVLPCVAGPAEGGCCLLELPCGISCGLPDPAQPNPPLLSPRRGVYTTYQTLDKAPTPRWVLAIGGVGIVVGLATYGYQMIQVRALGGKAATR